MERGEEFAKKKKEENKVENDGKEVEKVKFISPFPFHFFTFNLQQLHFVLFR